MIAPMNTVLEPWGYVLRGTKTHSADRFVLGTNAHGQVEPYGLFARQRLSEEEGEA
jgi:hypothetical protein